MYGDLHLMTMVVNSSLSQVSEESKKATDNSSPLLGTRQLNASKEVADAYAAENPLSDEEYCQFAVQHSVVIADLWTRVGLPEMAVMAIRRTLRQLTPSVGTDDYVVLMCKLLVIRVDLVRRHALPSNILPMGPLRSPSRP